MVMAQANSKEVHTLKHATLSGEIVTEDVLSRLAALYPDITISQIYASTELGSLVSVRDRRPGLPIALFEVKEAGRAQFRIVDSELQVRTPLGGGGWRPTGDLVHVRDGRVLFIGRKSEVINVGGIKVHPQIVESLVTPVEGVLFARAVGHPNPITGQIVRLDVVLRAGHRRESVDAKIRAVCNALGNHAKPRQIRYLDSIETNNMKLTRRVS
jgi:acyl-coenzyme A synthetase/AMP-(fatty) acid ligase